MKRLSQSGSSNFCLELRKNALLISQSHFSNFALHVIRLVITPPARRARRSFKFAPFLFFYQCRKLSYRSWVIPLAFLCCLAHCYTTFTVNPFCSRICNKTHILTCTLKYLNGNKVLRAKIPTKDVLKRQI